MEIGEIEAVGANTTYSGAGNLGTAVTTSGNGVTMDNYGYTMAGASAAGMYVPLSQYHFHTPSENTINGVHYPLEMHMVHKKFANSSNTSTPLLVATVISIMFRLDDSNLSSPFLNKLLSGNSAISTTALYATAANYNATQNLDGDVVFNLMTDVFSASGVGSTAYYAFNGSLTTPGCTEGLNWRVMATPLTMSSAQLAIFRTALALKQGTGVTGANNAQGGDNRNVQPLNARTVLASTATVVSAAPKAVASVAALMAVLAAAIAF
jgi:carbonic anhydrase